MTNILLQVFARVLILSILWLAITAAFRNRSAATQHAWLFCGLLAMTAVPLFHFLFHQVNIAALPAESVTFQSPTVLRPGQVAVMNHLTPRPRASTFSLEFEWLPIIWVIGTLAILVRYVLGWIKLREWVRKGEPQTIPQIDIPIIVSRNVVIPMTAGIGRSVIVVPLSWKSWSQERQDAVILHEMSHIRRGDWACQLGARVTCALFWPNLIVWLLTSKLRFLAERAADDAVLSSGLQPTRYAQILLETVRETAATPSVLSVSMAQGPYVARRIELILRTNTQRGSVSKKGWVAGTALLLGTALPMAVLAITRHAAPTPTRNLSTQEPVQLLVDCTILKPGVSFASTGLTVFAETHSINKSKKADPSVAQTLVYSFPVSTAKNLLGAWNKANAIASHPVVRTLSGQPATISFSSTHGDNQSMKFLPNIAANGNFSMGFEYQVKQNDSKVVNETSIIYTSSKLPYTVVFAKAAASRQEKEVIAMITVSVVKPDGP